MKAKTYKYFLVATIIITINITLTSYES